MREFILILAVIALLLGLTAIRYRRQIVAFIRFWREIQAVRQRINSGNERIVENNDEAGIQLVKCVSCSKWLPPGAAVKVSSGFACADSCDLTRSRIRNE
jgi:hypothetical protein